MKIIDQQRLLFSGGLKKVAKKDEEAQWESFKNLIGKAGVSELTEFSRAVHAEMEAILHAARNGFNGLRNATLYVTTFPCENCVKHILAAGIKRVVYVEPYPKSRAVKFFEEFIAQDPQDDVAQLKFKQFTGISPNIYGKFFKMSMERKGNDGTVQATLNSPMPLTNVYMDSFTLYEAEIAQAMVNEEKGLKNGN